MLSAGPALAADIRDMACKTTAECLSEADKLAGRVVKDATSARGKAQDQFYWMGRINMASTVMLLEEKIIPPYWASRSPKGCFIRSSRLNNRVENARPTCCRSNASFPNKPAPKRP